jgi:hypothetical protein
MYRILGADQKQYGPVAAEQIRQWIKERRVNEATLVQADGSTEWKPLSGLPEFAPELNAPPPALPSAPSISPGSAEAERLGREIIARDFAIDAGGCLSRSWALVKGHFWLLVGASFVIHLIQGVPVVGGLISGPLYGGLFLLFLKLIRGQRAEFGDAFAGFTDLFLQLFLAGLVVAILRSFGFLLLILPGIYLAVAWIFAVPLVIDRRLEFWPAMELSRKVVSHHWWQMLWLCLLGALVCLLGFLVFCVGIYVAVPVVVGAYAYAYEDIFGSPTPPPARLQ